MRAVITYETSTNIPRYSIKTVLRSYDLLVVPFLCVKSERASSTGRKGAGEREMVLYLTILVPSPSSSVLKQQRRLPEEGKKRQPESEVLCYAFGTFPRECQQPTLKTYIRYQALNHPKVKKSLAFLFFWFLCNTYCLNRSFRNMGLCSQIPLLCSRFHCVTPRWNTRRLWPVRRRLLCSFEVSDTKNQSSNTTESIPLILSQEPVLQPPQLSLYWFLAMQRSRAQAES